MVPSIIGKNHKTTSVTFEALIMDQDVDMYGYLPSKAAALFGIIFFSAMAVICTLQMIFGPYKHWWMTTVVLLAVGEAIGWGGRYWAHLDVSF